MPTVKEELGWLPESIWHISKGDYWKQFLDDKGDPMGRVKDKGKDGYANYPYSVFNPLLAERIYRYWSKEGDNVLDPFAGRTTRGLVARIMDRNYEGYEIAPQTFEQTEQNLRDIEQAWQPSMFSQQLGTWKLWLDDGIELKHTLTESKDLVFTCPPYWTLETYEQAIGQLSQVSSYSNFMFHIKQCASNCYRVLKRGGYCVWVIGDFRKDKRFYAFHSDTLQAFVPSGLQFHDIVINKLNTPFVTGMAQAFEARRTIKTHEYILVWRKL